MRKLALLPFAALALYAGCGDESGSPVGVTPGARGVFDSADPVVDVPAGPDVAATHIPFATFNNPTCGDLLPGTIEIKVEPVAVGSKTEHGVTVWITRVDPASQATEIDWHASVPMDGVLLKSGSDGHFLYNYAAAPAVGPQVADDGLETSGQAISHVSFCFTPRLAVSKTAVTRFSRTYDWDIAKTGDQDSLTLSPGQQFLVNYDISVFLDAASPFSDHGWAVEGEIHVSNPWNLTAVVSSVGDAISGFGAVAVSCSESLPATLTQGESMTCSYSTALPDASSRTNTATVAVGAASAVQGNTATAPVAFDASPDTELDECIEVTDDNATPGNTADDVVLGTACVADALPKHFQFARNVGPFSSPEQCGDNQVTNVASFVSNDGGDSGNDGHTVSVDVACIEGCTLTQGYWKTHSDRGPAPYDDAWQNLGPLQEDTPFFISGQTWYVVFWTAPAGNAYYVLAHQYQAAKLNRLNGAGSTLAVDAALSGAEGFFAVRTPASVLTRAQRQQALGWAGTLDQYNNGLIGPGHCSESPVRAVMMMK